MRRGLTGLGRGAAVRWAPLALAIGIASGDSSAATVDASSITLVAARPDWRDGQVHTVVPFIEWVSISAKGIEGWWFEDIKLNVSAWGAADSSNVHSPQTVAGDVDVAYVQGSLLRRRITLRLGRQFLPAGVGRAQSMDGLSAEAALWRRLGITAYGGAPVVPRFAVARGDTLVGGRLFWRQSFDTEVGASIIQVMDHGLVARRDLGADFRYAALRSLSFTGFSLWSIVERRLAQGELSAQWQATSRVSVLAAYRRTSPDLLLPRTSLFSVFVADSRTEGGGEITWEAARCLSLTGNYFALWTGDGVGRDANASATIRVGSGDRLGARVRSLSGISKSYVEARTWFQHRFSPFLSASIDLQSDWFDIAINGRRFSSTATGNIAFSFAPGWTGVLTALGGVTPFFDHRFEGMAKVVFNPPILALGGAR